jgi:hypothetical protein
MLDAIHVAIFLMTFAAIYKNSQQIEIIVLEKIYHSNKVLLDAQEVDALTCHPSERQRVQQILNERRRQTLDIELRLLRIIFPKW